MKMARSLPLARLHFVQIISNGKIIVALYKTSVHTMAAAKFCTHCVMTSGVNFNRQSARAYSRSKAQSSVSLKNVFIIPTEKYLTSTHYYIDWRARASRMGYSDKYKSMSEILCMG